MKHKGVLWFAFGVKNAHTIFCGLGVTWGAHNIVFLSIEK